MMQPLIGITASSIDHRGPAYGEVCVLTRKYAEGVVQGGDIDPALYGEAAHPATDEVEADRDRVELALARWAVEQEKPLLAICREIQVLNVALGGTLMQDIPSEVPDALEHSFERGVVERGYHAQPVKICADSRLAQAMQTQAAQTNSWHHQAIRQAAVELQVTAYAPDGVIEAVEVPGRRFAIGVQWHPEWLFETQMEHRRLFEELVRTSTDPQQSNG